MSYYIFYFALIGASLLLSVMGLWFTFVIPGLDRWSRRFFLNYFAIFMLCCLSGAAEIVFQSYIVNDVVFRLLLSLENLLLSLPILMMTWYLLHCCGEDIRSSKLSHATLGLWVVFLVLNAGSAFIDGFYFLISENMYYHGSLYPLLLMPMFAVLLLNLTGTMRRRARLSRKALLCFLIATLPMTVAVFVHMFIDFHQFIDICTVLSALSMYGLVLSDQIEQNLNYQREIVLQERKIAHERASNMVLQMRPHFIYNTLMGIHSLCTLDPQKAQLVTEKFTDYLRKNFNAVSADSTIPFSEELEHTHAYLTVEQAQYEEMLIVDWDTAFTHFRLPPLTLQPIVENAVKHAMKPSIPLRISVRTRHLDSCTEIVIENTGLDFDPSDDSKPHTTLENIRQRLEMMCGGSLTIKSREGGGTVVTITIPDSNERKKEVEEL